MDSYKRVDVTELRKGLAGVIESAQTGPVILRNHGEEVAALVSIEVMRNVQGLLAFQQLITAGPDGKLSDDGRVQLEKVFTSNKSVEDKMRYFGEMSEILLQMQQNGLSIPA